MEIERPQITETDREIYSAAPVFFRLKDVGYLDPEDLFTEEDLAFCREHGVTPHPPERRYPIFSYWGIETPPGWHKIVLDAVIKIEGAINQMMAEGMSAENMAACMQIKSKFGGLRISYRNSDQMPWAGSKIEAIIDEAKKQARLTCVVCGAPGRPHEDLFMDPLCTPCTTLRKVSSRCDSRKNSGD